MALFHDLGRSVFSLLLNAFNKSFHQSHLLTSRCSLAPSIVSAHQNSFPCGTKNYSAYSCWHFKNSSNLYNARSTFYEHYLRTRNMASSNEINFSSDEKLLKRSALQFGEEAKSLIAMSRDGFRQSRPNSRGTIIESSPATHAVSALLRDLNEEDIVVEINPGPGFLTRELLERTKNKLIICESREFFRGRLTSAFHSYIDEGRLIVSAHNFYDFYAIYLHPQSYHFEDPVLKMLGIVPVQSQLDRLKVRIVGVNTARQFMSRLQLCTILGISIMEKCDPTFYLFTTDILLKKFFTTLPFDSLKKCYKHSFLSNFVFKADKIGVEKCNGFYPLLKQRQNPGVHMIDSSVYHFIRIEPNWTFLNQLTTTERELFAYFVLQLSQRFEQNLLIDTLEMWLPGIGIPLIDAGFNVFTFSVQLTKEEVLLVYQIFKSHPSFADCSFARSAKMWANRFTNVANNLDWQ